MGKGVRALLTEQTETNTGGTAISGQNKKGRKLKVVKGKKNEHKIVVASLSEQNLKYLQNYRAETSNSMSRLVNLCIDYARTNDGLKNAERFVPASIRRAQEMVEAWQKRNGAKAAAPTTAAAKRGRPKKNTDTTANAGN